jgi:hypothetical protein
VACSSGVSYFFTLANDSPSFLRISELAFPSDSSTWFLSLASASVLASVSPLAQFTAFTIRMYLVPICAIDPSSTTALCVRSQISLAMASVNFASAGCFIIWSVCSISVLESKLKNGDCSSCTSKPCRSAPSNTASPVVLAKSPSTILLLSVSFGRPP